MAKVNQLSASLEDYLEAIFNIISTNGGVRVKDIVRVLDVKAGSVTTALQALTKAGHINYKPYGIITLTSKGLERAKKVTRKHQTLKEFFVEILGSNVNEAESAACKMEHAVTDALLNRLISFTEFVRSCPQCGSDMINRFHCYYKKLDSSSEKISIRTI